jgi:ABC-2 type transport system permease protein
MRNAWTVFKREVSAYFTSPLAYIVIVIFLALSMGLAFFLYGRGGILESDNASLTDPFFSWHPWLYIVIPALVAMRLWSEEHRLGTSEWLFTMPAEPWQAVLGKFFAASFVWLVALLLTFPIIITVSYLGDPDPGPIWTGYLASFLYAASCLAITSAVSAFTRSQAICAIISVVIVFVLTLVGLPQVAEFLGVFLPSEIVGGIAYLSLLTHFTEMNKGVLVMRDLVYFLSIITFSLVLTSAALQYRRA